MSDNAPFLKSLSGTDSARGDIAKGDRVMCRRLDAPACINTRGVAVGEQAQHQRRVIRDRTSAIDDVDHEARQVM